MIYLKDLKDKSKIIEDFFKWALDKDSVPLSSEIDLTLAQEYMDPNIYYTKEIAELFQTKAMKRLGRVAQLGLAVSDNPNNYHNRLDHSKGTYNRKLEELIYLTSNQEYRKYIEDNNLKLYLIAELIKEATHDIGHLPLSHVMEIKVVGRREFHEDIGKRIVLEDEEIGDVLKNINPNLRRVIETIYRYDTLNMEAHDEGNYDVDRMDYVLRDSTYNGDRVQEYNNEQYRKLYVCIDDEGNILKNSDGSLQITNKDDMSSKEIDVYENDSLKHIEDFLKRREKLYEKIYFSKPTQVRDSLAGDLGKFILNGKTGNEAIELRKFLESIKKKDIHIDLKEYLGWDDIKFYNNCLDIAENCVDKNMRDVALMTIPTLNSLLNLVYSHLDLKREGAKGYASLSDEDKMFVRRIKQMITKNTDEARKLRNNKFYFNNRLICTDDRRIEELRKKFGDKIEYSSACITSYKSNMPIYIKDKSGKVYTLHEHPERTVDWENRNQRLNVAFATIPQLKLQGCSMEEISAIKSAFGECIPERMAGTDINMTICRAENNIEDYFDI